MISWALKFPPSQKSRYLGTCVFQPNLAQIILGWMYSTLFKEEPFNSHKDSNGFFLAYSTLWYNHVFIDLKCFPRWAMWPMGILFYYPPWYLTSTIVLISNIHDSNCPDNQHTRLNLCMITNIYDWTCAFLPYARQWEEIRGWPHKRMPLVARGVALSLIHIWRCRR